MVQIFKHLVILLAAIGLAGAPAHAQVTNLLTNGNFSGTVGKVPNTGLSGWTNNLDAATGTTYGYNFLYNPIYASTITGGNQPAIPLWGQNDGGANTITAPPGGGYFVGMDGAYEQGALSQTINGLTVGQTYYVSFEWAGAQQYSFTGATTEQFAVALLGGTGIIPYNGGCATAGAQCTTILNNPTTGFTGWNFAGFTFTATQAQETLSFLAIGTPSGQPPFSLLANVSLQIAEPSTLAMLGGLSLLLVMQRRRSRKAV